MLVYTYTHSTQLYHFFLSPIYINNNVKRPSSVANITTQAEEQADWREADGREADGNKGTPEVGEWVEEGEGAMGMIGVGWVAVRMIRRGWA